MNWDLNQTGINTTKVKIYDSPYPISDSKLALNGSKLNNAVSQHEYKAKDILKNIGMQSVPRVDQNHSLRYQLNANDITNFKQGTVLTENKKESFLNSDITIPTTSKGGLKSDVTVPNTTSSGFGNVSINVPTTSKGKLSTDIPASLAPSSSSFGNLSINGKLPSPPPLYVNGKLVPPPRLTAPKVQVNVDNAVVDTTPKNPFKEVTIGRYKFRVPANSPIKSENYRRGGHIPTHKGARGRYEKFADATAPAAPKSPVKEEKKSSVVPIIITIIVVLLVAGFIVWMVMRNKKKSATVTVEEKKESP